MSCLPRFFAATLALIALSSAAPAQPTSLDPAVIAFQLPDQIKWLDNPRAGNRSAILDRKSTRLNSSHLGISYAVFCLKKKKKKHTHNTQDQITKQHQQQI